MITVICSITVIIFHVMTKDDVKGTVISQNDSMYVVDFSKEAASKGYEGDYSQRIVRKYDCVEIK